MDSRYRNALIVTCAVLLFGASGALVVHEVSPRPSAPALQHSILAFLDTHGSAHAQEEGRITRTEVQPQASDTWKAVADFGLPDQGRAVVLRGDHVIERVFTGHRVYERIAPATGDLADGRWTERDMDHDWGVAPDSNGIGVRLNTRGVLDQGIAYRNGLDFRPLLRADRTPVRAGAHSIRIEVSHVGVLEWLLGIVQAEIDRDEPVASEPVAITLTSGPRGRLDRVELTSNESSSGPANGEGQQFHTRVVIRFSAWGVPLDIRPPDLEAAKDLVDVEAVLAAPFPVPAPAHLPARLELLEATYEDPEAFGLTEPDCGAVTLYYGDPAEEEAAAGTDLPVRYLLLQIAQLSCVKDDPNRTTERGRLLIPLGEVEILVESSLTPVEIELALREFVPFAETTQHPIASSDA